MHKCYFTAAPSSIRIVPPSVVVEEGQGFKLTCEAKGDPVPTFTWYINGILMRTGADYDIPNAIYTEHNVSIFCSANNIKGIQKTWADIDVQCKLCFVFFLKAEIIENYLITIINSC